MGRDKTIYTSFSTRNDSLKTIIKLIGINTDGIKKWEYPLELPSHIIEISELNLTIDRNGVIYICTSLGFTQITGVLYAVTTGCGGLADTPWPMYRHDPQHTGRQH